MGKGGRKKILWKSKERKGEARKDNEGLYDSGPSAVGMLERKAAILSGFHAIRLVRPVLLQRL